MTRGTISQSSGEGGPPREGASRRILLAPMPRSVRALSKALQDLPGPGDPARLEAVDHLAARLVSALARFCDRPAALVPPQRALLLLGGRPGSADDGLATLLTALQRIDSGLGGEGGFSRLLESALEAGDVVTPQRLQASGLQDELAPLGRRLEQIGQALVALDDLAHSLGTPATAAAGALLADATWGLVAEAEGSDEDEARAAAAAWTAHREASEEVQALLPFGAALWSLDDEVLADARAARLTRSLALWVLAVRLADAERSLVGDDRAALEQLLHEAGPWPLAVFSLAESPKG